jgi:predicted O-methyltransferase YrrM
MQTLKKTAQRILGKTVQLLNYKERKELQEEFGFSVPPFDGMQDIVRMRFLHSTITKYAKPSSGNALEIGCFMGCSTVFLAKACMKKGINNVYAMDLFTGTPGSNQKLDTYQDCLSRLKEYHLSDNVSLIRANSHDYNWRLKCDVIHIDADHRYEAVKKDIEKYLPFLVVDGLVIFDDYDKSHPDVKRAVHERLSNRRQDFEVKAVNNARDEYGSICLRKTR